MARFGRALRLLRPKEFKRVFDNGAKSGDEALLILGIRNDLPLPRLGLAIAKKHLKKAVDRNRIKRLVRESFRSHQEELTGLDLVELMIRVAAGDYNIQEEHLADAIELLVERRQQSLSGDRSPKNPD